MKTIQKFVTDDGVEHSTIEEAKQHEFYLEIRGFLQSSGSIHEKVNSATDAAKLISKHPDGLYNILMKRKRSVASKKAAKSRNNA